MAFALLKEHNKPKTGRHSWAKRDKCDECKKYQDLWHLFIERVNKEQKGIEGVSLPVAPAPRAAPLRTP